MAVSIKDYLLKGHGLKRGVDCNHSKEVKFADAVLEPVLDAVSKLGVVLQRRAGATVLKVVCYAWLEHIRVQKIKFSLWGAQQLLKGR